MAYWNHRVIKKTINGEDVFGIYEVFYNADGSIYAHTEDPVEVEGESVEVLREYLQQMLRCLDVDILVGDEIVFKGDA